MKDNIIFPAVHRHNSSNTTIWGFLFTKQKLWISYKIIASYGALVTLASDWIDTNGLGVFKIRSFYVLNIQ